MIFFRKFRQLQNEVADLADQLARLRTDLRRRVDRVEYELGIGGYCGFGYVRRVATRSEVEELQREIALLAEGLGFAKTGPTTAPARYAPKGE
jgi:hypothetical protein